MFVTEAAKMVTMAIVGDAMAMTNTGAEEMGTVHRVSSLACMMTTQVHLPLERMGI